MTVQAAPTVTAPEVTRRASALDALRGLAILMMVLSGTVPAALPAWMHHAQVPPPRLEFNPNIPGITWVDLVFPFFLFAMGAAIPLALSRRLARGAPLWRAVLTAFQRMLLLGLFAVYVEHIHPFSLSESPGTGDWLRALAAFAALFPILARLPQDWPAALRYGTRAAGWLAAAVLMASVRFPDGSGFSLERSDIIIMILANVVAGTTLVWLATRDNWLLRMGALGFLMAVRMAAGSAQPNWVAAVWNWQPPHLEWLWHLGYCSYLFITLPGTVAGEMLLRWMRPATPEAGGPGWTSARLAGVAALAFAATPLMLWGLFTRHVHVMLVLTAALGIALYFVTAHAKAPMERLLRDLSRWGLFWLVLGLLFEPYEGGIKKDPATMSYYFVTAGLAFLWLVAFTVTIDVFRGRRFVSLLVDSGQNPMIAYIGLSTLVQPILFLTGLNPLLNRFTEGRPMAQFWHGAAATLLLALIVSGFTRARVFWRT